MKKICVIGGGPAGMMAAYAASLPGDAVVHIYEKNEKPGRKLLITGKGRCNITNIGDMNDFIENIPRNASFLYSSFSTFNNLDLISLLEENGLKTKIERGGRVFPASDRSADVAALFTGLLKRNNVDVSCRKQVDKICYDEHRKSFDIFFRDSDHVCADAVIIATGGLSYPLTGSTGDGYKFASSAGHSITELHPSLTALKTKESTKDLSGLTLKNIAVKILDRDNRKVFEDFGELLFTHTGVSGPVILSGCARITERVSEEIFRLYIDLKPALDEKMLDIRLLKDFNKNKNKDVVNALDDLLPKSLIPEIIRLSGIPERKKVNEVTKSERASLVSAIKGFHLTITGTEGFDNAIITRGGISVNEVNPKTMESKLTKGLFFAGEILDVDAYTGGYNLQIAFSTGYLAGKSAYFFTGGSK